MRKLFVAVGTMLFAACAPKFPALTPDEFARVIKQEDVVLVDVRTPEEFAEGHIAGAKNIDWRDSAFARRASEQLDKSKTLALYCKAGRRSHAAAGKLSAMGYQNIVELRGGIEAWLAAEKDISSAAYECDEFQTASGMKVRIHALMHASMRIEAGEVQIYVDPVTQLGNRSVDYAAMPSADFILLTHQHHDHLDRDAISALSTDRTQLIANKASVGILGAGLTMANGDKRQLREDISVEAVAAYNTTEGHLQFHPKGRDNGYLLTIDGLRIYIAGDTEDIPEMEAIKNVDIAFLPCNQPYTMTPEQLVRAAKIIRPKVLFPYHYSMTDLRSVPPALENEGIDVRIRHYE